MATQHPDNAAPVYWGKEAFLTAEEEVEECYRCYKDLGCQEYMWDWEGKYVDEATVDKLLTRYLDFFKQRPLGRELHLTVRIPNVWFEKTTRTARQSGIGRQLGCQVGETGILSASGRILAESLSFFRRGVLRPPPA
jgi:phosphoenolpyruvate carboxylase